MSGNHSITVESDDEELRKSGSSLSASIVAPSINANGKTGPSTTSGETTSRVSAGVSDAGTDFESVAALDDESEEEEDSEDSESDSDSDDESSDEDLSDGSLVVVSDEDNESDGDDF